MGVGLFGRRRRQRAAEVTPDPIPDDESEELVVTIGHEPDSSKAADAAGASETAGWTDAASAAAAPDSASGAQVPMTRELVPFRPQEPVKARPLIEDPTLRRVAAATAVGLVGLAVGAVRWRRQG